MLLNHYQTLFKAVKVEKEDELISFNPGYSSSSEHINVDYDVEKISADVDFRETVSHFSTNMHTSAEVPDYTGSYTAIPRPSAQSFETVGKKMTKNFVVQQIPYFEISNEYGYTVNIGGL